MPMQAHSYTKEGDVYIFHYHFADIKEWIKKKGGLVLTKSVGLTHQTYRGYYDMFKGPVDHIVTYNTQRVEEFDGPFDPDKVINPDPAPSIFSDFRILMPKGKYQDDEPIPKPDLTKLFGKNLTILRSGF